MAKVPATAAEYDSRQVEAVRAVFLHAACKLQAMRDQIVVVGGLVPGLLIPPRDLPAGESEHPGTLDADFALSWGVENPGAYQEVSRTLREAGFSPSGGSRWTYEGSAGWQGAAAVPVDVLVTCCDPGGAVGRTGRFGSCAR